mmetsp:Transcript_21688/g.18684  ORF Transcript_21688/g.18684 Transcript_21688/m.18684 type:complete len:250 (-) Transcript_21688:1654-2403(-)
MKTRLGLFVLDALIDKRDKNNRNRIIREHSGLTVYPFEWNILHIAAIYFGDQQSAKICLDAGIKLGLDAQGYTPIHHQLKKASPSFEFLSFIFDNFEKFLPDSPIDQQKVIESLSPLFLAIIGLGSNSAANVLNYFVSKPIPTRAVDVPEYGQLRKTNTTDPTRFVVTDIPFLKYTVAKRHISSSYKPITLKMLRVKQCYDLESSDMMDVIHLLKESHNEAIFNSSPVKILTEYAWSETQSVHRKMGIW